MVNMVTLYRYRQMGLCGLLDSESGLLGKLQGYETLSKNKMDSFLGRTQSCPAASAYIHTHLHGNYQSVFHSPVVLTVPF